MDSSHGTGHRKFWQPRGVSNVLSGCLHADIYLFFFLIEPVLHKLQVYSIVVHSF